MTSTVMIGLIAKATLILGAAALTSAVLRHGSASLRHLIWSGALVAVIALPVAMVVVPQWRVAVLSPSKSTSNGTATEIEAASATRASGAEAVKKSTGVAPQGDAADGRENGRAMATGGRRTVPTAMQLLQIMWAAGAMLVLAWLVVGRLALARIARRADAPTTSWSEALARESAIAGLRRDVRLLKTGSVTTPVTFGVFAPVILLPGDADGWDAVRQRVVLQHELSHVARGDALTQLVAGVACALYWFHPAAWLAAVRLRIERERACDDRVLMLGMPTTEYAAQLLDVARAAQRHHAHAHVSIAMGRPSQLEGRLRAILDETRSRASTTRATKHVAAVATVAGVIVLAAFQPVRSGAVSAGGDQNRGAVAGRGQQQERVVFVRSVSAQPGGTLVIDAAGFLPLQISGVDSQVVSLRGRLTAEAAAGVKLERVGDDVHLTAAKNSSTGVGLVVHVPLTYNVRFVHQSADIRVADVAGRFTGSVQDGWVTLERVRGHADLDLGYNATIGYSDLDGQVTSKEYGVRTQHLTGALVVNAKHWRKMGGDSVFTYDKVRVAAAAEANRQSRAKATDGRNDTIIGTAKDGKTFMDVPADPTGPQQKEPLFIAQESGSISIEDVANGGYFATANGDITLGATSMGPHRTPVGAQTGTGNIRIGAAHGYTSVAAETGDIEITVADDARDEINIVTNHGNVILHLPRGFTGDVELETSWSHAGPRRSITTPFALRTSESDDRAGSSLRRVQRATGQVGDGGAARSLNGAVRVRVRARDGNIVIL